MNILSKEEMKQKKLKKKEEKRILKEIEESFCVAGYDILDSTVFKEMKKEQHG